VLTAYDPETTPLACEPLTDLIRVVHSAKWNLLKLRQDRNCSYKELCTPMADRCRFLMQDIRPCVSWETRGLERLQLEPRSTRWPVVVRRVIKDISKKSPGKERGDGEMSSGIDTSLQLYIKNIDCAKG